MMGRKPKFHFLRPAEGRTVPRQDGTDWPAEGEEVEETRFVRRRMRDGDLVKATRRAVAQEPEPETGLPEPQSAADTEPQADAAKPKRPRRKAKEA